MSRDPFGSIAAHYDRIFPYPGPERLAPLLDLRPGQALLDVGGGTARVSQTLPAGGTRVVLDQSLAMLQQGRGRGVLLCAGLAEGLPFADASFDRCLFVDSFHHLEDQRLAMREALRVLRPGGRLVIEEPDIRQPLIKIVALAERLLRVRSRIFAAPDMERLIREAGGTVALRQVSGTTVRLVAVH